jgi:uncharacterized membrane protein
MSQRSIGAHVWQLPIILLIAFTLRLINLTFQPLWFDEGWSVWFANSDLLTLFGRTAADIHPPFYYVVLHLWVTFCGTGEFALRLCSALIGVVGVAALYRFATDLCDERVGRLTALLAAIAPMQIFYAQEIRMYGLVTTLGVVSSWLFWRALQKGIKGDKGNQGRYWVAYIVVTSAVMHTQYYGAFIPLFHGLYWLFTLVARRSSLVARNSQFANRKSQILFPLISFISLLLLYTPWLWYVTTQLVAYVGDKVSIEQYAPLAPHDYLWRHLVAFSVGHLSAEVSWLAWATILFVILTLIGALHTSSFDSQTTLAQDKRSTPHASIFLLSAFFIPILAAYLIQLRFPFAPSRMERLLLLASPPFIILVARGLLVMSNWILVISHWRRGTQSISDRQLPITNHQLPITNYQLPITHYSLLCFFIIVSGLSLASFYTTPRYPDQDYRPMARRINTFALPTDVIVVVHPWQQGFLQAYLQAPVSLQRTASDTWGVAVQSQLNDALGEKRRVWLVTYQALGRVLESELEKYLAAQALMVDVQWHEKTKLTFYAPAPSFAITTASGTQKLFGLHGEQNSYASGWGIVPLKVFLEDTGVTAPTPQVSLRLRDAQQRIWAMQDRQFTPQPEAFASRRLFSDQFGFLIPAGTPPGRYQVSLALYAAKTQQPLGDETRITQIEVVAPDQPLPIAALPIQTSLIADWFDTRLLGYTLHERAWRAGESLPLDLFWQARETVHDERLLFVQLQDAQGKPYVINEGQPAQPTSAWRKDNLLREQRALSLPATLPAGRYRVVVGWLTASGHARMPLERGGTQVVLREIDVLARPHQFTAPAAQTSQQLRFGDVAQLVGYDWRYDAEQHTAALRLHWQALREMETAYKVFVHLTTPNDFTPIAQHDSAPANGTLPTTSWVSHEYITDEHLITLPPDMPRGAYHVLIGLYDPQSNTRVPAFDISDNRFTNDAAELMQFEMK